MDNSTKSMNGTSATANVAEQKTGTESAPTNSSGQKNEFSHEDAMAASTGGPSILSRFTLSQSQADAATSVKKRIAVVQVTNPKRGWWWRANPEYQLAPVGVMVVEAGMTKETYLVARNLVDHIGTDVARKVLHGAMTRQGLFFAIAIALPGADGRVHSASASMQEAVSMSYAEPVRTAWSPQASAYDIYTAVAPVEFPPWPEESWADLVGIAFKDRVIETLDHPVLRQLRGEV